MKAQMLALLFIAFINYINNYYSVCASSPPPYQWNLINSGNNVQIFAQLIDDIYQQSQPIAKLSFNLTFVKYASELANFRVIEHFNEEMCPTFKVNQDQCVGFQRYSNKLDNFIANEFNKNIFCPEKPIPKMVVDQIMQLIFSFAARILLCLTYIDYYSYDGIGEWQMQTLLSAYKMLAARNDNNEDGIFPFPIEQIGGKGDHMWAKFMNQNISEQTSERKQFIAVLQSAVALSKIVVNFELNSDKKNEEYSMDGITKLNEFKLLFKFILSIGDTENNEKLENYLNAKKKHSLNELSTLLKQVIEEYSSCTSSSCPFRGHFGLSKNRDELTKFGQILFETFNKYSDNVKYDEKQQLLSFPSALSEHILRRLNVFVQRLKLTSIIEIGYELDFVKTIQNIASMDNIEFIQRKTIPMSTNKKLFKLLFTFAIRLSAQIEQNDLAEEYYLKTFLFAVNQSFGKTHILYGFFALKIRNINKMVEVNLPTWKLPYSIYLENKNELEQENAFEKFKFIHSLSEYSPTIYELIKMANILGEINDGQIWISPSDSEIFLSVLKYLTGQEKPTEKIKVPIQNEFSILAYFVEDLLEKAVEKNNFPVHDAVELALNFVLEKHQLCDGKPHFRDNMLRYFNGIEADIDPQNELQQIIPAIIEELEEMLQKRDWMCAKLNAVKNVEWTLLKFDLDRLGQIDDWNEIDKLRSKWRQLYDDWFRNGVDVPNFAKLMEKMKEKLKKIGGKNKETKSEACKD